MSSLQGPDVSTMPVVEGVTHRWVEANGVDLHLAEAGVGNGAPIVLLHGWPQHWWTWRDVMTDLAVDHHVIAVDLRGHGWSGVPKPGGDAYDKRTLADDVIALLETLGLDRPVLAGHDWGGWVAQLVAGRAPELVSGVVAVGISAPWAALPPKDLWRFTYQAIVGGPWGSLAHRVGGQIVLSTMFARGGHPRRRITREDVEPYLERFRDPARAAAGRALYARFLGRELGQMRRRRYQKPVRDVPILMLPGSADPVLPPRIVGAAVRDNVTMQVISGAGHWVPEEQPAAVAGALRRFAAEVR